jgi:hypothetical protein
MDAGRFDHLAQLVSTGDTRRGLLRLLATVSGTGGLLALTGREQVATGRRRKNKRKRKHKKQRCRPQSPAETCADRCGSVKDNCKRAVDCGPCGDGRNCCGGNCCAPSQVCSSAETCCTPLTRAEACATAIASGQVCGAVSNGCGGTYICGCPNEPCQTCTEQDTCVPADGPCDNGNPCTIFDTCDDGVCTPGTAAPDGTPCANGGTCCSGLCTATCCENQPCDGSHTRCCNGICEVCRPRGAGCGGDRPDCACTCCSGEGGLDPHGQLACL